MKCLNKVLEVTVTVDEKGNVMIEYYEPESGDYTSHKTTLNDAINCREKVGNEILSWATLMADELDDVHNCELCKWYINGQCSISADDNGCEGTQNEQAECAYVAN